MAMNREQKRAMQKRGMSDAEGAPVATRERRQPQPRTKEGRTPPRQYLREVVGELRKTSWPTRSETLRLALIVGVAIVVLTALIFGLDVLFGELLGNLLDTNDAPAAAAVVALPLIRITS